MTKITVLMPLYNGKSYIEESLQSIQAQTFEDWEFIIVNDYGSNDGCADIIKKYAEKDPRIKIVQAERRLGIAESLNYGWSMAQGEYIARVDVDDPSEPERFEKQVNFLDEHPDHCLCGCWQRSITRYGTYVQEVAADYEELKAAMMFGCEISHCGVMLRKRIFDQHNWHYDSNYLGEDFELWTRALMEGAIMENIPEPLVGHRWGFGNISIEKGERLWAEVSMLSARYLQFIGVNTDDCPPELLRGWRNRPDDYAKKNRLTFLQKGCKLLLEIEEKNNNLGFFESKALKKVLLQRWDWIRQSCGLSFLPLSERPQVPEVITPIVSVVLPTFCSADYICRAIDSVLGQTFTDWELLVINDFGSFDGTVELVKMYAWSDPRIRLIQADKRLGLAESLNMGIRQAKGKYIARLDADDTVFSDRFAKQVALMESQPKVGVCGAWQQHHGKGCEWIHKTEPNPDYLRCKLLFFCDLCHSTLMLRKSVFIENQLFYDPNALAEDYELWTRAMEYLYIINIPEILGTYNESTGITNSKRAKLAIESGEITGRTISRILGIKLDPGDYRLLNGWISPISNNSTRESDLKKLKEILIEIWQTNETVGFFNSHYLLKAIAAKWNWVKNGTSWDYDYKSVRTINDALSDTYEPSLMERYLMFRKDNPRISTRIIKLMKKALNPFVSLIRRFVKLLFRDAINEIEKSVEDWTWERYNRINEELNKKITKRLDEINEELDKKITKRLDEVNKEINSLCESNICNNPYIPLYPGQKIRMMFLFQIPSFWPSWESFYESCLKDDRIELVFALLDEKFGDTTQMKNSRAFLENNNIPFVEYSDLLLAEFQPHIMIMQTPYDDWHRSYHVQSATLKHKGVRLVYITYGIEIADTEDARNDHFNKAVMNCWRIYTFSERMRLDYMIYSDNGSAVRALGHPKFDSLLNKEHYNLPEKLQKQLNERKMVLWHIHFPKFIIQEDGTKNMATPYLEEYLTFLDYIKTQSDIVFVLQPHPKFLDCDEPLVYVANEIIRRACELSNVYIDYNEDYRSCLVHANYLISDRSAIMIEAATMDIPVLYMSNIDYYEPMTVAVAPLVESYEQGHTCQDMIDFVERCRQGQDLNHDIRNAAFHLCIPYNDGKSGERIKEDIINSLKKEIKINNES